jgi:threonine synthase
MRLVSTNGGAPETSFREAVLAGLAPDGGLYLPTELPRFSTTELASWRGLSFPELAVRLATRLLNGEFTADVIERLVLDALNFPAPTVRMDDRRFVLELFHGPTLAFKDFGARFLARFFGVLLADRGRPATILVATSGDTGSAVARGFFGVPNIRVVVLYPAGKVSAFQEAQMGSAGGNVTAVRVSGTFDDCQRLVKAAFLDPSLAHLGLSSANSINIGRLLPQTFYYVASYLDASPTGGGPVVFSVPSGNLGNLTAGVMAARMGVPVERFVAGTNVNDVLPEYLATGIYRARAAVATMSNAMDVGDPSNFPRLLALFKNESGAARTLLKGERVTEAETGTAMRDAFDRFGRVLDPHGAVAFAAGNRYLATERSSAPVVVLATAHPAKFADAIRGELGCDPTLPAHERDWRSRPLHITELQEATPASLCQLLCNLPQPSPV